MRFIVIILTYITAVFVALGTAHAVVPIADEICTFSTASQQTISDVIKPSVTFDCSKSKYDLKNPKKWVKIPFKGDSLPPGVVELQGDTNGVKAISLHAILDNGQIISKHFTEQDIIKNLRPKSYYGLPVPGSDDKEVRAKIETLYIASHNPQIDGSLSLIQLASKSTWDERQASLNVMLGILAGMLIIPSLYTIIIFAAIHHRFMMWHFLKTSTAAIFTLSSSGLLFLAFPLLSLSDKLVVNYWSLALGIFISALFFVDIVERDKIANWLKRLFIMSACIPIVTTIVVLHMIEGYNQYARFAYFSSYAPYCIVTTYAIYHAWKNGSKVIWIQIAAWTPILLFGLDRIARAVSLYEGWAIFDYGLYFALVFENLILAFGIAYRLLAIQREHSNVIKKQSELKALAYTDGLTNVGNRRALEEEFAQNMTSKTHSHIAILDIDFFKQVNDDYGHEIGDEVLRTVGRELTKLPHFSARIGGEEFAILMNTSPRSAKKGYVVAEIVELCENMIKAISIEVPIIKKPVTFSAGIAPISKHSDIKSVMEKADRRLYLAKRNGRNQIINTDRHGFSSSEIRQIAHS